MAVDKLDQILERIKHTNLPPVHLWNPEFSGEMDMRIATDGHWFYCGSLIKRQRMVKLFSTILRREQDDYFLVTPVEKFRIQVDDFPFVALEVDKIDTEQSVLVFRTNVNDEVIADAEHPIKVYTNPQTAEPRPYIEVRDGLNALIHRNVFYQLVEWAEQKSVNGTDVLVVESGGVQFALGEV